jgi:hypothetical protein
MNGQLTIIHFGHQVGEHMIDHHIPIAIWQLAFNQISQLKQWTNKHIDHTIQSYQLENCVHELDISNGQILSYIPTYSSIEFKTHPKLANFNTYLQYQVTSERLSEQSFQPITKYYNTTKVQRSEFGDSKVTFIFDQKENHCEIMILHWLGDNEEALVPYLELLSSIK